MSLLQPEQYQHDLAHLGGAYAAAGYSVIPCLGDLSPGKPKVAALQWQPFTTKRATPALINKWFLQDGFKALAIVLGRVSGLIALDFDSDVRAKEFAVRFPELQNTWIVRSAGRGLPHYYYALPPATGCATVMGAGVELRGDNAYIIAPPSCIAGREYRRISKTSRPRLLTPTELEAVRAFCKPPTPTQTIKIELGSESRSGLGAQFTLNTIAGRYLELVGTIGRNNALFRCALEGRDSGLSVWEVTRALVPLHINQARQEHRETAKARQNEAIKSIASAYSKPPRPIRQKSQRRGMPNSIRESLLQAGCAVIARVLDALYAVADWKPGRRFTEVEAMRICRPLHIARKSVRAALLWLRTLTAAPRSPLENPPTPMTEIQGDSKTISCKIVGVQMGTKQKRHVYTMPRSSDLAAHLGVKPTWADRIDTTDLETSKRYRQALYKGILERKPGQYPRRWHGHRLGVSRWTIRRYSLALQVEVKPVYHLKKLAWNEIKTLPSDIQEVIPGIWLEIVPRIDLNTLQIGARPGKKYPPLAGIAKLLFGRAKKSGGGLALVYQQANHYRLKQE